jgi:hypothetical protein
VNKALIFSIFLILPLLAAAQKPKVENDPNHDDRPIHFGFSLGMNFMDYRIEHSEYALQNGIYVGLKELSPGINIHAIANLRLSERWDLRTLPGISFGERYVYYMEGDSSLYPGSYYRANSSYIEIPLTFKYKSQRLNNFRPYLVGGANVRYDLAIKSDYDIKDQLFMVRKLDYYAEIGLGLDFYMVYFKLGLELKYSFSPFDIMEHTNKHGEIPEDYEQYTNSIDHLYSHMVILLFNFE